MLFMKNAYHCISCSLMETENVTAYGDSFKVNKPFTTREAGEMLLHLYEHKVNGDSTGFAIPRLTEEIGKTI